MLITSTVARYILLLGVALSLAGCVTSGALRRHAERQLDDGGGFGFWEQADSFQRLQRAAGLEEGSRLEVGEALETDEAQGMWEALAGTRTTLQSFGPRRALVVVLRQVLGAGEEVPYAEVLKRTRPFEFLVVMRPDGYLVSAVTGRPLQRMGRVELREGRLMAGQFEVGAFYWDRGGVFYPVDESLQRSGPLLGELGLERDWFNAALDGAEDALGEMVLALAQLVTEPIHSIEGLKQLPSAVAVLIASSPEYFARYSALPLQEQIREAARLATHLLMLYGSAAGTATRIGTAGARLPVLSLSAEGALAVEQVLVPVGATAKALGTGAGAVYVLMTAERAPGGERRATPAKGPGEWRRKKFSGSERSRRYQEQITGRSADEVYFIGKVEYDGFNAGVLKEAKGPGYRKLFKKDRQPEDWYKASGNFQKLLDQAARQSKAARGTPVYWHMAEREMVDILRSYFDRAGIENIQIVHTPPIP
ncbi:MAG: hypothetical protein JXB05_13480 [Myxococcaceae bacterium]|nr:hypothetical protein [Myxococcaceae bacterium]